MCGVESVKVEADSPLQYPVLMKNGIPSLLNLELLNSELLRSLKEHLLTRRCCAAACGPTERLTQGDDDQGAV